MDSTIAAVLLLDGVGNGAVYALLGMAIVLVFAVTRVILIPQGEFVAYSALTLAMLQLGRVPGTVWLALLLAALTVLRELWDGVAHAACVVAHGSRDRPPVRPARRRRGRHLRGQRASRGPSPCKASLTLVLVTSLGPLVYRLAYQPLADASVLLLLIVSVGVHFTLVGLGPGVLRCRGLPHAAVLGRQLQPSGPATVSGQTIVTLAVSALLMAGLYLFFARTLAGKALRATAIHRLGARLMGVSTEHAGPQRVLDGRLRGRAVGPADRARPPR